jgi:serine/threonine protein kinase
MSPELLDQQAEYGREVDLYSFAIVVNEMLTSELPWRSLAPGRHNLVTAVVVEKRRPDIPDDTPIALQEIVEACWQHDPARRPVRTTMIRNAFPFLVARLGSVPWCCSRAHTLARGDEFCE